MLYSLPSPANLKNCSKKKSLVALNRFVFNEIHAFTTLTYIIKSEKHVR